MSKMDCFDDNRLIWTFPGVFKRNQLQRGKVVVRPSVELANGCGISVT